MGKELSSIKVGPSDLIGSYSDGIMVQKGCRWLYTSGTPGIEKNGLYPAGIEEQAKLAWDYILDMLKKAEMEKSDIVKVTQYLTNADDIPSYVKLRKEILGDIQPAFMLAVVPQLIHKEMLLEVEIIAATSKDFTSKNQLPSNCR